MADRSDTREATDSLERLTCIAHELNDRVAALEAERATLREALQEIAEDTSDDTWASERARAALVSGEDA